MVHDKALRAKIHVNSVLFWKNFPDACAYENAQAKAKCADCYPEQGVGFKKYIPRLEQ